MPKERSIRKMKLVPVEHYDSIQDAATANECAPCTISKYLKSGTQKDGFVFEYYEPEMDTEVWKQHPILPIQCSSLGRVRLRKGRIASLTTKRYLKFAVNRRYYMVHRVIAETFIPKPEGKEFVNHIDRSRRKFLV